MQLSSVHPLQMNVFKAILLTAIGVCVVSGCSRPQTIVGVWRHPYETATAAHIVEFRKDGSFDFKATSIGFKGEAILWKGTYSIVDSNHIDLKMTQGGWTNPPPGSTWPVTLSYSLSRQGLQLQRIDSGDMEKYSRIR